MKRVNFLIHPASNPLSRLLIALIDLKSTQTVGYA